MHNNASRFKQEKEIANPVLVRKRQESSSNVSNEEEEMKGEDKQEGTNMEFTGDNEFYGANTLERGNMHEDILKTYAELYRLYKMELQQINSSNTEISRNHGEITNG